MIEILNKGQRRFVLVLLGFGQAHWALMADKLEEMVYMQIILGLATLFIGAKSAETIAPIFKKGAAPTA